MIRLFVFCFFLCALATAQQERYLHGKYEFELGSTELLFGDNVKLRAEPNTTSKVIELLPIASSVKILSKSEISISFNGFDSPWYKVNYQGKVGYVLGGLIALHSKRIADETYLVALKKENEEQFVKTRLVKVDASYLEVISKLSNAASGEFKIKAYDNRGLSDVKNMIQIDLISEACGLEGGGIYLFNDGKNFVKAFEYSEISDAGVYWYSEEYIFPTDENGVPLKIVFKKETGSYQDEATNWLEIEKMERELEWKGNQFEPKDYLQGSK